MLKIAAKDFRLFLKDRRGVMLTFFLPIFLITIFSLAFGGAKREAAKPTTLLVTDLDRSNTTQRLLMSLDSLKGVDVQLIPLDSAQDLVRKGSEPAVLVFGKGLEDSVNAGGAMPVELQYDAAKEMEIGIMQQALMATLMKGIGQESAKKKVMRRMDEQYKGMDTAMLAAIKKQVAADFDGNDDSKVQSSGLKMNALIREQETGPGLIQAVAGTAVMMLLMSLANMGGGMLTEKEEGTLKRLLYTPMNPNNILFGKMIASIATAFIQLTVMFGFASFVFDLDLGKNVPGLLLMVVATAFACASFGIFLAAIARTRSQLQSMSTLIVLTMSALGGSMIPAFIMPAWMQKISWFSVNRWAIEGFYDVFWRDRPVSEIAVKAGVLLLMGLALSFIAVRLFRRNVLKM
jgi:ABC-type multidrug transport system permease subunit